MNSTIHGLKIVLFRAHKFRTLQDSTTEAEYIAAFDAAKETVWIKKFVTELGVVPLIVLDLGVLTHILMIINN